MTYFFSTSAESSMTFPPRNTLTILVLTDFVAVSPGGAKCL
jgi:hypothetical protein